MLRETHRIEFVSVYAVGDFHFSAPRPQSSTELAQSMTANRDHPSNRIHSIPRCRVGHHGNRRCGIRRVSHGRLWSVAEIGTCWCCIGFESTWVCASGSQSWILLSPGGSGDYVRHVCDPIVVTGTATTKSRQLRWSTIVNNTSFVFPFYNLFDHILTIHLEISAEKTNIFFFERCCHFPALFRWWRRGCR